MEPNMRYEYVTQPVMPETSIAVATTAQQQPTVYTAQQQGTPIQTLTPAPQPTLVQVSTHRPAVAYKRPMPPAPRKIIGTTTPTYSPRNTPPAKIPHLQRAVYTKSGTVLMRDVGEMTDSLGPLTPPPTPECGGI